MTNTMRGSVAVAFSLGVLFVTSCSGGVSVPAAGRTAEPTTGSSTTAPAATATPGGTTTTAPAATATPGGTTTTAPAATATPTTPATGTTSAPTPTATATTGTTSANCPPSFPATQPTTQAVAFPKAGGNITLPPFGDQSATVNIPPSNAAANEMLNVSESQTTFTDSGGDGNIPTPPSGYTAISYVASFISPAQTLNFTDNSAGNTLITISASAPCEINSSHATYVAFVYANGGGLPHYELSPSTGTTTTVTTSSSGVETVQFTIDLSKQTPANEQPDGTGLETVFAYKD